MRQVDEWRNAAARRKLSDAEVEYRVEPSSQTSTLTPPLWLNEFFATANRRGRVLSELIRARLPLPVGVKSLNVPRITSGTTVAPLVDNAAVAGGDVADAPRSSVVAPFAAKSDWARQSLDRSPPNAHLDWAIFQDMTEAYDFKLEQLAERARG